MHSGREVISHTKDSGVFSQRHGIRRMPSRERSAQNNGLPFAYQQGIVNRVHTWKWIIGVAGEPAEFSRLSAFHSLGMMMGRWQLD